VAAPRRTLSPTARRLAALAVLPPWLASCRSLERFDTEPPAAYCGSLVGAPLFHEGFIPTGAPPSLSLALELDMSSLSSRPGSLRSDDMTSGFCSDRGRPLFDGAALRAIPQVANDALSQADFGEGHEHDFFAWVDSTCQGTMLAVVSLLKNGAVELRMLKPAPDPPAKAGPERRPGFALFYLERRENGCGF
jgi:hypothetical protein